MGFCVISLLAPAAAVQQGFRRQHNLLRQQVNQFRTQNNKLALSVEILTAQTPKLQHVEHDLQSVAATSGESVENLGEENGKIQTKIL